jgi:HJR/Mrr/RecB family endonuclease
MTLIQQEGSKNSLKSIRKKFSSESKILQEITKAKFLYWCAHLCAFTRKDFRRKTSQKQIFWSGSLSKNQMLTREQVFTESFISIFDPNGFPKAGITCS